MPNRFYKFVYLQLLNVKFWFSKKHIFPKQQTTAVYGRASIVLDFKLTRENDDLLFSRHKNFLGVPHPVHEYTKMQIFNKRYQLTWFVLFEVLGVPQLWGTSVWTISVDDARTFAEYKRSYRVWNFRVLDKSLRFSICSKHRLFPLPCFPFLNG